MDEKLPQNKEEYDLRLPEYFKSSIDIEDKDLHYLDSLYREKVVEHSLPWLKKLFLDNDVSKFLKKYNIDLKNNLKEIFNPNYETYALEYIHLIAFGKFRKKKVEKMKDFTDEEEKKNLELAQLYELLLFKQRESFSVTTAKKRKIKDIKIFGNFKPKNLSEEEIIQIRKIIEESFEKKIKAKCEN